MAELVFKYLDDVEPDEDFDGDTAAELWEASVVGAFTDEPYDGAKCLECGQEADDCTCEDGPEFSSDAYFDHEMSEVVAREMLKAWEYSRDLPFEEIPLGIDKSHDIWHTVTILAKEENADEYPEELREDILLVEKYVNEWVASGAVDAEEAE